MATQERRPYEPPWGRRMMSNLTFGVVGVFSRAFVTLFSKTETRGVDRFLEILDGRKDETKRERGLITVSNHLGVLDDPIIWGVLPLRYLRDANNMRWALGSYDICFKNGQGPLLTTFFTNGNTLPIHRVAHSKFGGLFQPTITEAIRLLSDPHGGSQKRDASLLDNSSSASSFPRSDPFSESELRYSTNGIDSFPAPSVYPSRRFSWVHIYPEGMIHQHPQRAMRYFKWGVARLILEAEPCPDVLPMWIDGLQEVMSEKRGWPRPFPRPGKQLSIAFGELVDRDAILEPFREKWQVLKEKSQRRWLSLNAVNDVDMPLERLGEVHDDELRYGAEAEQLRIDLTLAVRNEVLKVRQSCGLPDEDPKFSKAETWIREGREHSEQEGEMKDRSVVKRM